MPETHQFGAIAIYTHSWNSNRSSLALSSSSNIVDLYKVSGANYQKVNVLSAHTQSVTGIDWAPKSNRIVTCSADRNAYVWTQLKDGSWKNTMVILRINRAATCVKWSPQEDKFAVGSGAKAVSVCYFDSSNDWWVSKHIKKPIRSTVTCLDWHPNNILLAAGSSDFKARVFSAYVKDVEEKPGQTIWGTKMPFGNLMAELSSGGGGWVHDVCFSGNGDCLAWVGHDSSLSVVNANSLSNIVTFKTSYLPFYSCVWVSLNRLVAAGYNCEPMLFEFNGKNIKLVKKYDTKEETGGDNVISKVTIHTGTKEQCKKFSTTGLDGMITVWDIDAK
ncbi:hypothetical protein LSH36_269g11001 [Paralvinella palmiformis]|uniref:Arp2/3 complex 41 kDa subunit n=1 Tax=Paralvinella palmiformis TaxID=53620 RepID=A0AAD9JJZ7_9ANNE|nr:hypothetical protein LSH36_269g11001 [Paralvinella palmiformis]